MARPKKAIPDYRYHVSGKAVVTLDGKDFYLGDYDSPESRSKYLALLTEYQANGMKAPKRDSHQTDQPVTVRCVTAEFWEFAQEHYEKDSANYRRFKNLCSLLDDEHGDEPAASFGPRKLAKIRELFVASGNCRKYVNSQTRNIVRIFKHGVSRELVKPEQLVALQSLESLRYGKTKAKESKPVQPVDIEAVKATAKFLSPTLKAMVRLQAATGMRPSEIAKIRPMDIDRSGKHWIYRLDSHKTARYGKTKAVPIIGDAREALTPFLLRNADSYCFQPRESAQWYRDQRTAKRTTPASCGTGVGDKRVKNPKRQPGELFTKDSYRQAIIRSAKKAKVPHWFPYQLRHTSATIIREAMGIEAAQALLGHSKAAMTEHYAKQSEKKAIEAAKAAPSVG